MIELYSEMRTQSTLLIPNRLIDDYYEKTENTKREIYFRYLLKKYSPLITGGLFGKRDRLKLRFQNEGENLIKKNFRPFNEDWAQFGLLADYLGISMTALFTMILTLDIAGWDILLRENWYDRGVPPTIAEIAAATHLKRLNPAQMLKKIRYKIKR